MKILHAPCNVGNQAQSLCNAEKGLGHRSLGLVNYSTWIGYDSDVVLGSYQNKNWRSVLKRTAWIFISLFYFQIFHFYFGRTLSCWDDFGPPNKFWFFELFLLKRLGKKSFMTLQGCDARIASISNKINTTTPCDPNYCKFFDGCVSNVDQTRRLLIDKQIQKFERVFALNPELLRFVPTAEFIPYSTIDLTSIKQTPPKSSGPITIVHAPSEASNKGTSIIEKAIDRLSKEFEIDFIVVQNKTHREALQVYQQADIFIDQLLFGWYGGVSVEAMAMGKVVACYLRTEDFDLIPSDFLAELPIQNISVTTIENDLRNLIYRRQEWPAVGQRSHEFVQKWHDPNKIAAAIIEIYKNPKNSEPLLSLLRKQF